MYLKGFLSRRAEANQSGFTLIEVLIAEALMGVVIVALLVTLANSYKIIRFSDSRETAKNFAEYQMEVIKHLPYASSYNPIATPSAYTGYSASISVTPLLPRKQLITVTISSNDETYTLSDYKVDY